MLAKDIMSERFVRCTRNTSLRDAAVLMAEHGCACLPVSSSDAEGSDIIGMVTDHDLVIRMVAEGLDPYTSTVWLAMTMPPHTVRCDAGLQECVRLLSGRSDCVLVVIDEGGCCCGTITHADLVRQAFGA